MKTPLLAALALFTMAIPGAAQAHDLSSTPVVAQGGTLLTLSAEGRSLAQPDLASFSAGVTSQGKTATQALAANTAAMNRVMAALRKAGIADRDIQTSNLSLNPVYAPQRVMPDGTYHPTQPEIVGYQVNNTVTVRQRDLAAYGKVIDTLVTAGANQVNGPSFELDDPDAALDEARTEAITKARKRAQLYAKATGLRVVRILSISEGGGYSPPMPVMYAKAAMADMASAAPVAPGEIAMNVSVSVAFEQAP